MATKKKSVVSKPKVGRDAKTGKFVTFGYVKAHPATTLVETIRKPHSVKPVIPTTKPPPRSKKR